MPRVPSSNRQIITTSPPSEVTLNCGWTVRESPQIPSIQVFSNYSSLPRQLTHCLVQLKSQWGTWNKEILVSWISPPPKKIYTGQSYAKKRIPLPVFWLARKTRSLHNCFDKNTGGSHSVGFPCNSPSDIFGEIQHSSQTSFPKSLQVKHIAKSKPHLTSVFPA